MVTESIIWRDCPGAEKRYEVSSYGAVRNKKTSRLLSRHLSRNGYITSPFTSDSGKFKPWKVHQLVTKAFPEICGEWFDGAVVDHINADKCDNRASNLRVCTVRENCNNPHTKAHYKSLKPPVRYGADNNKTRPVGKYTLKGELVKVFTTGREAAKEAGVCPASICLNANGKTKTCGGFRYAFVEGV